MLIDCHMISDAKYEAIEEALATSPDWPPVKRSNDGFAAIINREISVTSYWHLLPHLIPQLQALRSNQQSDQQPLHYHDRKQLNLYLTRNYGASSCLYLFLLRSRLIRNNNRLRKSSLRSISTIFSFAYHMLATAEQGNVFLSLYYCYLTSLHIKDVIYKQLLVLWW